MKILLVAATSLESRVIRESFSFKNENALFKSQLNSNISIALLHTGIGMVNTAFALGEYLSNHTPDLAIHFGIAGSLDKKIELGQVVELIEDSFPELGAEDGEDFLGLETLGFPLWKSPKGNVYQTLSNPAPSAYLITKTTGLTVNTVHGNQQSIDRLKKRWNKQIETMEGAAFFLAMLKKNIPFYSFRGISNYVTPRDKSQWKVVLAAENVQKFLVEKLKLDY